MKKIIIVAALVVAAVSFGVFVGCDTPFGDGKKTETIEEKLAVLEKADTGLDSLVKGLAPVLLTDDALLAILSDELGKRFDGETEVLFSDFSARTFAGEGTVYDYIKEKIEAESGTRSGGDAVPIDFDGIIGNLSSLVNLQVYAPEYESWDDAKPLAITYLPLASIDAEVSEVVAYDSGLNPVTINEENLDDYRLLVLGPNERTDENGQIRKDILSYDAQGNLVDLSGTRGAGFTREGGKEYVGSMKIYDDHEGFLQGSPEFILYYKYGNENSQIEVNYKDNFDDRINQDVALNTSLGSWDEASRGTYLFIYVVEDDLDISIKVTVGAEAKVPVASGVTISGSASVTFEIKWGDDKLGNICVDYRDQKYTRYNSDSSQYECTMYYVEREICKPEHPCVQYEPDGTVTGQTPIFDWEDVPGADSFNLYVYRADNVLVGQVFDWPSTMYFFSRPFKTGTAYYWTVEGKGRCGTGPVSSRLSFSVTDAAPTIITPTAPKGSISESQPVFSWTSGILAEAYTLTVSRADNGAVVLEQADIRETSYRPSSPLPVNVNLTWKVSTFVLGALDGTYSSQSAAFKTSGTTTEPPTIPPTIEPTPTSTPTGVPGGQYTLSVGILTSNGGYTYTNYTGLYYESTQSIYAPTNVWVGQSSGTLYEFKDWQISGGATIDDPSSASTIVRGFTGNTTATANYQLPTPAPTPVVTEEPVTYSLRVGLMNSGGTYDYNAYYGLLPTDVQCIYAPRTIQVGGSANITLTFLEWRITRGSATIDDPSLNSTCVRNITSDTEVTAGYWQETNTPPPTTPGPTALPTAVPTAAPTAAPTAEPTAKPVTYTLSVTSVASGGTGTSQTYYDLTQSSTVAICTTSGWTIYTGYSTITITFVGWHVSGATLDNPSSPCTTVRNFTANASVSPEYKQAN